MTKSTRYLPVLVGALAIMALALTAAFPAFAQSGSGGQGGNTVVLQSGDTLGTLVSRYSLSGTNLRQFLSDNTSLVLQPGQTITFPADVNVNMGANNQGGSSSLGQATTTASTPDSTMTTTPSAAGAAATAMPTTSAGTGTGASGSQSYTTQQNDTLGTVLGFMSFTSTSGAMNSTVSPTTASGDTSGSASSTVAPTTSSSGTGGSTTGSTTETPTVAAGSSIIATGTATATGSSTGSTSSSALTDAQLLEFVTANNSLAFQSGQSAMLPAGIAVTGNNAATGTSTPAATTSAGAAAGTSTPAATTAAGASPTTQATSQSNSTTYTVQSGDTLQSIAARYGISVTQLLALNPNLLQSGQTINVPNRQGSIPQTGSSSGQGTSSTAGTGSSTIRSLDPCGQAASGTGYYKVRRGEGPASIANKFGVTLQQVLDLNPGASFSGGTVIVLPGVEAPGKWNVAALGCGSSNNSSSTTTTP